MSPTLRSSTVQLFAAALAIACGAQTLPAQDVGNRPCECRPSFAVNNRPATTLRPYTTLRPVADLDPSADFLIELHEDLLNRIVSRTDQRETPVRDFVMGADVYGTAFTTTNVRIDLQPSSAGVALHLILQGRNQSHTVGYTAPAAISTLGQHQFLARKSIVHEGRLFRTEHPHVDVAPNNQTVGAQTFVSGVPFLGEFASSIAFQAAEAQRSQGEAIAAYKLRDGVGTQFNQQVDVELAKLNRGWLDDVAPQLEQFGFDDIRISPSSTDDWARYAVSLSAATASRRVPQRTTAARSVTSRRIAADAVSLGPERPILGRIVFRESLARSLVGRLGLAGMAVNAADFSDQVTTAMSVIEVLQQYGLQIDDIPPEVLAALQSLKIKFADRSPSRVLFEDDKIIVQTRAALAVPPLIDLPLMQIDLAYKIDATGDDEIKLLPAGVVFRTVDDDGPGLGPFAPLLESQASAAVPAIRFPRTIRVPIPGNAPLELTVHSLEARDGTLTLTVN